MPQFRGDKMSQLFGGQASLPRSCREVREIGERARKKEIKLRAKRKKSIREPLR